MTPSVFLEQIQRPALEAFAACTAIATPPAAQRLLLAIAIQESDLAWRYQRRRLGWAGPARGWWQFERGGGVRGVMRHQRTHKAAEHWCRACAVHWHERAIWRALEGHDRLAAGFARLLLWSDREPIPSSEERAWSLYRHRLWRPGKPHRHRWTHSWERAADALDA
jgi:hypothetical protein